MLPCHGTAHAVTCPTYILLTILKGPKELKVTELSDPKPSPNDYLIEVHAAATNFFDILQIQGKYQNQPRMLSSFT